MRSCRSATVHAPCSGWPAKARLLVSTQGPSSRPGLNGPRGQGPGRREHVVWEREGDSHLQQVPLGDEPLGAGPVVVGGRRLHEPEVEG